MSSKSHRTANNFPGVIEYIIAIDPGKKTGWAHYYEGVFESGQAELWVVMAWLHKLLESGVRFTLVCEDFIINAATHTKSRQTDPLDGIGVVKWFAHHYELTLVMQTPVSAKKFSTDDKLKTLGWYYPTTGGHANDAARHLLVYMADNKLIDLKQLIS